MRVTKSFKWLAVSTFLLLAGCGHTNVQMSDEIASSGLSRPQQVLVYNFAVRRV